MSTLTTRRSRVNAEPKTAQLLLLLGDQQYAVAPVVGTPAGCRSFWLTKLPTSLSGRTVYTVTQRVSGFCDCSCPDHAYRQRDCKHIRALQALGVLDGEQAPEPHPPAYRSDAEAAEHSHAPSCCCMECMFTRVA